MIKKVKIENFQSHKLSTLEFSDGVNVIVGGSDSGKTAVIRGMVWGIANKPSGDSYRSNWGGITTVEIVLGGGKIIRRTKTNTQNSYTINNANVLKAFGQGVPPEVVAAFNMSNVNVQRQLDAPFLLSETAGEVAAHFNRIAGIDVIDKAVGKAKSAIRECKNVISYTNTDLEGKQTQLKQYVDIDAIERGVKRLERKDTKVKNLQRGRVPLTNTISLVKTADLLLQDTTLIDLEPLVDSIILRGEQLKDKIAEQRKLMLLAKEIGKTNVDIADCATLTSLEPVVVSLITKTNRVGQFERTLRALNSLVSTYNTNNTKLAKTIKGLTRKQKLMPVVCPLCEGTGKLK